LVGIDDLEDDTGLGFVEPEENYNFFLGNAFLKLATSVRYVADTVARGASPDDIQRALVDDSGLCVPALNFEPGVHSAYFGGHPRSAEKNRTKLREDIALKFNTDLQQISSKELRLPAFFVCFILSAKISHAMLREVLSPQFRIRDFRSAPLETIEKEALLNVNTTMELGKEAGGFFRKTVSWKELFVGLPIDDTFDIDFGYCLGEVSTKEQNLIPGAGHGYDSLFYAKQHPTLSFASIPLDQKNGESHRALAMKSLKERF
jgi:inosine/xanthosine triphosphate pyrophosphatase family protein